MPELEARGRRAIAADLPCGDEDAGAADYAALVAQTLANEEEVVLIAHSLGGLTAPLVAELRPVREIIFIAGLLPTPGQSLRDQQAIEPEMMFPYRGGPPGLRERFFNRCQAEDADWAMRHIRRQALRPYNEVTPLRAWPEIPVRYLVCGRDQAVNPAWGRKVAQTRLGIEPEELPDSDHSPFLSGPAELAARLLDPAPARGAGAQAADR